jgi:hypothetical protein
MFPDQGSVSTPTSFLVGLSERFALQHNVARFVRAQPDLASTGGLSKLRINCGRGDFMTVAFLSVLV